MNTTVTVGKESQSAGQVGDLEVHVPSIPRVQCDDVDDALVVGGTRLGPQRLHGPREAGELQRQRRRPGGEQQVRGPAGDQLQADGDRRQHARRRYDVVAHEHATTEAKQ